MSVGTLDRARPIEPRLRARRIEVARDRGRRRLRRVAILGGIAGGVVALVGVALSPVLDVDRIEVVGAANSGPPAVAAASGISAGDPLVRIDPGAAAARIEALPWVESASVRRDWPGTVQVVVEERVAVGVAGSGAGATLLAADGTVLGPAGDADLPRVSGGRLPVGAVIDGARLAAVSVLAELPGSLRAEVARARATGTDADPVVTLVLTDGIAVRWGSASQSSAKADALAVLLEQADRPTIDAIDVSVPSAATVTRQGDGA